MSNVETQIRFVILSAPRCGSNMLCSLLHSHSAVLCHHELYNPNGIFYALPLRETDFQLATGTEDRDSQAIQFLSRIWQQNQAMKCVGFKMTHRQNPTIFETVLTDPGIKKIVLRRKNEVKSHVSRLIAEHCGLWEAYGEGRQKNNCQVHVDWNRLKEAVAFDQVFYHEIYTRLQQTQQVFCQLDYDSLSQVKTQHRMLDFLQLPYEPLHTQTCKQNPSDLRQVISNFPELLQHFANTPWLAQLTAQDG